MTIADQLAELPPTVVTYPAGSLQEDARIVAVLVDPRPTAEYRTLLVCDRNPFHPLDPLWPDQPDDTGWIEVADETQRVHRTLTIAQRPGGPLMVENEIEARRDEPGVEFRVALAVDDIGAKVRRDLPVKLRVDRQRRQQLSAAHTACHLLAYALNGATHHLWRKIAPTDARGHYDLDRASCVHTHHAIDGSVDRYRLGKSLRRRGFDTAGFLDELPEIIDQANQTLADWISTDAPVWIDTEGPLLTDRRTWICELPDGTAHMPCGGTHVQHLAQIASMRAAYQVHDEAAEFSITNTTHLAPESP